jgi:hypothetical protein
MGMVIVVQLLVIFIDIMAAIFDFAKHYAVKSLIYAFTYALKLELEFVALNQLIAISRLGQTSLTTQFDSEAHAPSACMTAPALPAIVTDQKVPAREGTNSDSVVEGNV